MNRRIFILLMLFVLSRIIFINPLPIFFDSLEYLNRFSYPNLYQAIVTGHFPFHISYVTLFWSIFHVALLLGINPPYLVILSQIIISAAAIYCFYRVVEIITDKKTAFMASVLGIVFPVYWISNASITAEPLCVNFFLISIFFFALYAKNRSNSLLYLFIACVSFEISLLTNAPIALLWCPFLLSIVYFLKKEKFFKAFFGLVISSSLATLIDSYFINQSMGLPFFAGIRLYLFNGALSMSPKTSFILIAIRSIRNVLIPVFQNNTLIVLLLVPVSLIRIFRVNKKLFICSLLWILPIIFVDQWFNPSLSGRHGIIAEFGFAFLIAVLLKNRKMWFLGLTAYLLIVFLPGLWLLKEPIPYLTQQHFVQSLPNGLLIETHFARPQISGHYKGQIIFVNDTVLTKKTFTETINRYLAAGQPVFITSQALSDPYGLYSGPYLDPMTLSYGNRPSLERIIPSYAFNKYAVIDNDAGLLIYEVTSRDNSAYPSIPILRYNRHTLNYFDPINQLWLLALKNYN
jgi:hypothetical protein